VRIRLPRAGVRCLWGGRGKLRGFYVKQIATGGAGDFSRMTNAELEAFIYGNDKPAKSKH
jgi:hypothetical protein